MLSLCLADFCLQLQTWHTLLTQRLRTNITLQVRCLHLSISFRISRFYQILNITSTSTITITTITIIIIIITITIINISITITIIISISNSISIITITTVRFFWFLCSACLLWSHQATTATTSNVVPMAAGDQRSARENAKYENTHKRALMGDLCCKELLAAWVTYHVVLVIVVIVIIAIILGMVSGATILHIQTYRLIS